MRRTLFQYCAKAAEKVYYTPTHEWFRYTPTTKTAVVGVTSHLVEQLAEVVYVEPPKLMQKVKAREAVANVESVKATSDVLSPVSGTVDTLNNSCTENLKLVNKSPEDKGWIFSVKDVEPPTESSASSHELMNAEQYKSFITTGKV